MRIGRQNFAGTALLETSELLFRGDTRLRVPFASISKLEVQGDALHVTYTDGLLELALGETVAMKWAEKIRSPRTLADKLGIKAGMRVSIVGVDDEDVLTDIEARGAILERGNVPKGAGMVLWRIANPDDLARLPGIARKMARDGSIWVVHRRGDASTADVVIFSAAKAAGLTYTKVVRFSDTDTAEKLVIPKAAR
ncbi:MAG: DUF3052 family protein [bacterium]